MKDKNVKIIIICIMLAVLMGGIIGYNAFILGKMQNVKDGRNALSSEEGESQEILVSEEKIEDAGTELEEIYDLDESSAYDNMTGQEIFDYVYEQTGEDLYNSPVIEPLTDKDIERIKVDSVQIEDSQMISSHEWHMTGGYLHCGGDITISADNKGGFRIDGMYWNYGATGEINCDEEYNTYFLSDSEAVFVQKGYTTYIIFIKLEGDELEMVEVGENTWFGMGVSATGRYTHDQPEYMNENVFNETYTPEIQSRIQTLIGEIYDEYFVFPTECALSCGRGQATFSDGSKKEGLYYSAFVPHEAMRGYEMFISDDDIIYLRDNNKLDFFTEDSSITEFPEIEYTTEKP